MLLINGLIKQKMVKVNLKENKNYYYNLKILKVKKYLINKLIVIVSNKKSKILTHKNQNKTNNKIKKSLKIF